MQSQLERALSLAKKTGDRLLVFESPTSENGYVVMPLEQYENILECDCGDDCKCSDHDDEDFDDYSDLYDKEADDSTSEKPSNEIELDSSIFPEDMDEMPVPEVSIREEVRGLTEEELLDKINRDIARWKESQETAENTEMLAEIAENEAPEETSVSDSSSRTKWAIKPQIKENADEIIEEDRHYLEEVRY